LKKLPKWLYLEILLLTKNLLVKVMKLENFNFDKISRYYTAAPPGKPFERHLYRSGTTVNTSIDSPQCLTCHLITFSNQTETGSNYISEKTLLLTHLLQAQGACRV